MDKDIIEECIANSIRTDLFQINDQISEKYFLYISNLLNFKRINQNLTPENIYRKRLVYFNEFYREYKKLRSEDAGFEQQIGNLIVEIANKFPDFDWSDFDNK